MFPIGDSPGIVHTSIDWTPHNGLDAGLTDSGRAMRDDGNSVAGTHLRGGPKATSVLRVVGHEELLHLIEQRIVHLANRGHCRWIDAGHGHAQQTIVSEGLS